MPEVSVPDKPIHLTLKKRAQLRRVIAGEPIGQASLAAGYSSASTGSRALRDTRAKLMEAMERYSLTDGVLVRDYLLPLLNATQTQHTSFMGSFTDSVTDEDNHIRLAALRETFKLRGAYPKEEGSGPSHLSITLNNIAVTEQMPAAVFARWFTSMDNALTFAEAVLNDCVTKRAWLLVQCYKIKHGYLVTVRT